MVGWAGGWVGGWVVGWVDCTAERRRGWAHRRVSVRCLVGSERLYASVVLLL